MNLFSSYSKIGVEVCVGEGGSFAIILTSCAFDPPLCVPPSVHHPLFITLCLSPSVYQARLKESSGTTVANIPQVRWADVGGLINVKDEIMDAIETPIKFPELFKAG